MENLTYATLIPDTLIRCLQTGEEAVIRCANDDGSVSIKITSGPDAGDYVPLFPSELITYWRAL